MGSVNPADHIGLVVSAVKRYAKIAPIEELVQEGTLGLMRAAQKFDPARGCEFSTYATLWIRQAARRYLSDKHRTIRIPAHLHDRLWREGALPAPPLSMDYEREGQSGEPFTLHEVIADDAPSPEDAVATKEETRILWREVAKLPRRTARVLRYHFIEGLNLREIGDLYGLTRERIRQIESEGLQLLQRRMKKALA